MEKKTAVLSGGERSRLALARLFLRPANLLLLDEPTNHLDLDAKRALLNALADYQGTIVFVAHDRYFMDALATRVAAIGGGGAALYWGNYSDYLARISPPEPDPADSPGALTGRGETAEAARKAGGQRRRAPAARKEPAAAVAARMARGVRGDRGHRGRRREPGSAHGGARFLWRPRGIPRSHGDL